MYKLDIFPGRTTSLGERVKLLLVIIYEQHQDFNMLNSDNWMDGERDEADQVKAK